MLKKETVHNFRELGDNSIDDITNDCKRDFADKCFEIVKHYLSMLKQDDESLTDSLFNIRAYGIFDDKGRHITYQNQALEYEELKTDVKEYFKDYLERGMVHEQPLCCKKDVEFCSNEVCEYLLQEVENDVKEDLGLTLTKPKYKRYEALFGLGEFPFMMIRIVRIGNKRYYFYQITR